MKNDESRGRILAVDNITANLKLLRRILETSGYEVFEVEDGDSAIQAAKEKKPDLILLDVNMPVMNGYETCARLKADESTRGIPIIFISALDDADAKYKAFQSGGVDYIIKPVGIEEVQARVEIHLSNQRLQSQLRAINQELADRIQELTVSQALLQERESKLQAFINAMPNLSFVYNEEGRYLEILSSQTDLLRASVNELKDHRINDLMPADIASLMMNAIHETINTGITQVIEYKIPVLDGNEHWFEGRIALMEKDDTGHGKVVFIATEISERVRLYDEVKLLATRDSLTGCLNRRHFLTLANQEYQHSIRYQRSLSILMLDIDHFKLVNDQYGHPVGDQVLCALVELINAKLRSVDIISRHGGEEFTILLPETQKNIAYQVAERLRAAVEEMEIWSSGIKISMTISIGVASLDAQSGVLESIEMMIHRADQAMYDAKVLRNCVRGR
jgi:two-component system cell cycle response regulator